MNKNYKLGLAVIFSLIPVTLLAAEDPMRAIKLKAGMCLGCHGIDGRSINDLFPSIAGQTPGYIEAQLKNFKAVTRKNSMMEGVTKDLTESEIKSLASYFAAKSPKTTGTIDTIAAAAGKDKVAMCQGCHGENLAGKLQTPRLAGQHPDYLARQLRDFKSGQRQAGQMNAIAKTLSDDDIKVMSAYLSTVKD